MKGKILAILFIFATCVLPALAVEKVKIGDLYYNLNPDDRTAEVTSANKNITSVNIPSTVEYNSTIYSVTSIGRNAFWRCEGLTSVTIPNSITHIGVSVFLGCENLKTPVYNAHYFAYLPRSYKGAYTIPDGIRTIAQEAFLSCKKITSVTIPNTVRSIENKAFFNCRGLASVIIPDGVTDIGDFAFYGCITLNSVTFPNSVTIVGKDILGCCDKLEKPIYNTHCFVYLPRSYKGAYKIFTGIESIAPFAFGGCYNLISVKIPNSVTSIGESAFVGCANLKEFHYPQGLDLSQAGIPSSTKLVAYSPTNSFTNTTTASSRSNSDTNSATTSRTASSSTTSQSTTPPKNTYTKPPTSTSKPICTILSPADRSTYSSKTIKLRYTLSNMPSEKYKIKYYVNEKERYPLNNGSQKGAQAVNGTEVELEMPIDNGRNASITIVMEDANQDERIIGRRTLKYVSERKPTLHVFAVGLSEYPVTDLEDLKYGAKDAQDFVRTIKSLDCSIYKEVKQTVMLNKEATADNVRSKLMQLTTNVAQEDVVMLFFSGHGLNEDDEWYFMTYNVPANQYVNALDFGFIKKQMQKMSKDKNCHVFIFMDACHSGGMYGQKGSAKNITAAMPGVIGYYSSAASEKSRESDELRNGVFTYALINGLQGRGIASNNEGQITTSTLRDYIENELKQIGQTPIYDNQSGDYVIFYKKK